MPDRVILNGSENVKATLLIKSSGLKIESIQMDIAALILHRPRFSLGEQLPSDTLSPERLGDPQCANEASIPMDETQKTAHRRSCLVGCENAKIPSLGISDL